MGRVYLITGHQVKTSLALLCLVVEFVEKHVPADTGDPGYADARAKLYESLNKLIEGWQHLPHLRTINRG